MDDDYDILMKLIIIGDSSVGKTNLLTRFAQQEYREESRPTVGVEFAIRNIVIKGKVVKAQIWDTAGQEKFKSIAQAYYRGAAGAMICYDITNELSFSHVDKWISELNEHSNWNIIKLLVATKSDLEDKRLIRSEDGIQLAKQHGMAFIETSALTAKNVVKAYTLLLEQIFETIQRDEIIPVSTHIKSISIEEGTRINIDEKDSKSKEKCC